SNSTSTLLRFHAEASLRKRLSRELSAMCARVSNSQRVACGSSYSPALGISSSLCSTQWFHNFITVMKLWNHCVEHNEDEMPSAGEYELPHATLWELLTRAHMAESSLESLFLKLASAWNLSNVEVELL